MTEILKTPIANNALSNEHEQLVRGNITWMLALAERILKDRAVAEDCVREVFTSAIRELDHFDGRSGLKTWLHRTTVNAALGKLQQTKSDLEDMGEDLKPVFDQYGCRVEARRSEFTPLEDILKNERLKQKARETIDALPDSYRIVLLLRDIEGYNTLETSKLLDISEANVKVRLHRARVAFKRKFEPFLDSG